MVTQLPLKQPEKKTVNSPINRRLPTPRNTIALQSQHRLIVHRPSKFYIQCILQTVRSFLKKGQRNVSMITSWDLSTWSRKTKQRSGTAVVPQALAWRKINLRQGTSNRACSASEQSSSLFRSHQVLLLWPRHTFNQRNFMDLMTCSLLDALKLACLSDT